MDAAVFADLTLEELRAWRAELVVALRKSTTGKRIAMVGDGGHTLQYDMGVDSHARIRRDLADVNAAIEARESGRSPRHGPIYLGIGQ
jgi:hypothetical protein